MEVQEMTDDDQYFNDLSWALDQGGFTGEDRRVLLTATWTLDQIPKIETGRACR
jgi:hypothetical protein